MTVARELTTLDQRPSAAAAPGSLLPAAAQHTVVLARGNREADLRLPRAAPPSTGVRATLRTGRRDEAEDAPDGRASAHDEAEHLGAAWRRRTVARWGATGVVTMAAEAIFTREG
jgi:hypothetical protein